MPDIKQDRLRDYVSLLKRAHGDLQPHVQEAAEKRRESASGLEGVDPTVHAEEAVRQVDRGADLSTEQAFGLEAIIDADIRPAIDIINGTFTSTHPLWIKLSQDQTIKMRIERVIPSVGRIGLPGNRRYPYAGTGFVVGNGLLMTNRHVAEIFSRGLGSRLIEFLPNAKADVDFLRELNGPPNPKTLAVEKTIMIHPYWDMAILKVDGLDHDHPTLELSLQDARELPEGHEIFVIGYPAFDPRNPSDEQQELFDGNYGVKRLQPGALHGRLGAASFGKTVPAAAHDCSTLGGNSGSAVFDLSTGQVLGLHFGGQYHQKNYAVPSFELSRDTRIVDAGVKFFGDGARGGTGDWANWWARADQTETTAEPSKPTAGAPVQKPAAPVAAGPSPQMGVTDGSVRIEMPLIITVSLGRPGEGTRVEAAPPQVEAVAEFTEAMREPFRDTSYDGRTGYSASFLNENIAGEIPLQIPLPGAADPTVLAKSDVGENILKYEHFSIAMHEKRRIALFTASNVVATPELKKPEPGKDYTRRGLSGLGPNDQEKWFPDPRINARFQLPDVFYNKDRQAFDKGHIVRREDVAWGKTYDELRRANGDTYHVTNCSPQVKEFNRSTLGDANWGDLENNVLSEAASERLSVFAGPVLTDDDRVFTGAGDRGTVLKARIPEKFWKVVVVRTDEGCAAFGFILEQDLSDVEWEFTPADELVPFMYPISDISEMAGVRFPSIIIDNDQYATTRGGNVALRSGAKRKRRSKRS
ncbi:DNA/RNA non-specific endonuclease [Bradyrhizobium sp. WSM 1738]|uniref:DNA/RNA non-specific endonuclease n=1 Tax=Bradyrhizobium hereditatis TaxID=2821405 RepID=UPI001CE39CEB|nr:DNA/RNA non-specific endonuclease [Bradyrhizobium hereditatis]MCA6115189.1 DNA/RNA non-specific endonuclease [Bradyrhizobium hereditatis]